MAVSANNVNLNRITQKSREKIKKFSLAANYFLQMESSLLSTMAIPGLSTRVEPPFLDGLNTVGLIIGKPIIFTRSPKVNEFFTVLRL